MVSQRQQRALASLSIYSETLSADELARLVPFPPEQSFEKGTPRGRRLGGVHPHSVVAFESHVERSAGLSTHLDDLLRRVDPAKGALRAFAQRARSEGFQSAPGRPFAPVVVWLRAESADGAIGFDIPNEQLKAIFEIGADLAVELEADESDGPTGDRVA